MHASANMRHKGVYLFHHIRSGLKIAQTDDIQMTNQHATVFVVEMNCVRSERVIKIFILKAHLHINPHRFEIAISAICLHLNAKL